MTAPATELTARERLAIIKTMVCGERAPNWSDEWAVGATRGRIADLCEERPAPSTEAPSAFLTDRQIKSAFHQYGTGRLDGFTAAVRALAAIPGAMAEVRALAAAPTEPPHTDDAAVDRFAAAMKRKLAIKRAEGRGGWDDRNKCTSERLAHMLCMHVTKGDPVDIANFAMMIHQRDAQGIENGTIDNLPNGFGVIRFVARHAFGLAAAPATLTPADPATMTACARFNPTPMGSLQLAHCGCSAWDDGRGNKGEFKCAAHKPAAEAAPLVHSREYAAFDAWARANHPQRHLLSPTTLDLRPNLPELWLAWQARAALAESLPVAGSVREGSVPADSVHSAGE